MAKNAVAKKEESGLPAELMELYEGSAGQGVSTSQEDTIIPLLYILQDNSPQVKKRDPKYIEGCEPGDILLTSLGRFWKGDKGLLFQPCAFGREWVEWRPRNKGGGMVGRHASMPADAEQEQDEENPQKQVWVRPNGMEIVDTRYHFGFYLNGDEALGDGEPLGPGQAVLPLSSTGHTFSRQWMTQMGQIRLPNKKIAPSRARQWRLTTIPRTNGVGQSWFGLTVHDEGWIQDAEQFDAGTALFEAIQEGSLRAADPEQPSGGDGEAPF